MIIILHSMHRGLAAQITLFGQVSKINVQVKNIVIMAASLLLAGFGVYPIWLGVTRLLSH